MQTVYLLTSGTYECEHIGIFSSYKLADTYAKENEIYAPDIISFGIDEHIAKLTP